MVGVLELALAQGPALGLARVLVAVEVVLAEL